MPSAFLLKQGVSNYCNSHITFNLRCNWFLHYSICKKAFHTTTHQSITSLLLLNRGLTSRRHSRTCRTGQIYWCTLILRSLFPEFHFKSSKLPDIYGLVCAWEALSYLSSLWALTLFGLFRCCFDLLYTCLGHQICNILLQIINACAHLIEWGSSSGR